MRSILALQLAFIACAPPDILQIPTGTAKSMLLTTLVDGAAVRAEALAIGEDDRPFVTVPRANAGTELYAAQYECALEGLGLVEGQIGVGVEGYAMPPPKQLQQSTRGAEPVPIDVAPALDEVRYRAEPPTTGCFAFTHTSRVFEETGRIAAIVPDGDAAVVVSQLQLFFRFDADDSVLGMASWGGMPAYGATRAQDGSFYFGGWAGRLTRLDGATQEELPRFPGRVASHFGAMWLSVDDARYRSLFLLSDQGDLGYFDGTGWRIVYGSTQSATISVGAVEAVQSGEAFVVGLGELGNAEIGHVIGGNFQVDRIDLGEAPVGHVLTVTRAKSGRLYAGTDTGAIAEYTSVGWLLFAKSPEPVAVIAELDGVLLVGGKGGVLRQVGPDAESCPALRVGTLDQTGGLADVIQLIALDHSFIAHTLGTGFPDPFSHLTRVVTGERLRLPRCEP